MVKYLGVFLLVLLPLIALAQKEDRVWAFGFGAGIDFNDTANIVNFHSRCANFKTTSSVANPYGNLMFYIACDFLADTCVLIDGNNNNIPNADSISAYSGFSNGSAIISFPDDSIYIIFYIGRTIQGCALPYCFSIFYTKLKLNNNGSLYVLEKNIKLTNELAFEKLAVVKHANGKDWWLVAPMLKETNSYCTNKVFSFLVTKDTIEMPIVQHVGKQKCGQYKNGDMVFSQDGSTVAITFNEDRLIESYDFNRCSGLLANPKIVDSTLIDPFFTCFSENGKILYISKGGNLPGNNALVQYYLDTSDVSSTRQILWEDSTNGLFAGAIRLAPSGKIYFSSLYRLAGFTPTVSPFSQNLGVIHSPNELGVTCDFRPFSYYLGDSALATAGLPNLPNYNLGSLPIYQASAGVDTFYCQGDSTIKALPIGGDSLPNITYLWQPAPGIDSLNVRTQLVKPNQSRWYYVSITDTSYIGPSCNSRLDSVYVEVRTCTGITKTQTIQAKLYPNPANGLLNIEVPVMVTGYAFQLYNLVGQQIMNTELVQKKTVLQLDYPSGIYLYQITHNGQVQNGKLVVE